MSKVDVIEALVSMSGTGQQVAPDVLAPPPVELLKPKVALSGSQTVTPDLVT